MGGKPRYPEPMAKNFHPILGDHGFIVGAACSEFLTTKCDHKNDITAFCNKDRGVMEFLCHVCRCTWERLLD